MIVGGSGWEMEGVELSERILRLQSDGRRFGLDVRFPPYLGRAQACTSVAMRTHKCTHSAKAGMNRVPSS